MGASHKTTLLLIGLGAAGCMSQGKHADVSEPKPSVSASSAPHSEVNLATGETVDPNQRAVYEAVNNQGDRISRIIRERDAAKQVASDIREQRESHKAEAESLASAVTGAGDAVPVTSQREIGTKLTPEAKRAEPDPKPQANQPPSDWDNTILSAAQTPESGDFGDAAPVRRGSHVGTQGAQGSVTSQTEVQRVGNGPLPSVGRASGLPGPGIDPLLALQEQYLSRVNDQPKNLAAQLELQLARLLRNEPVPAMADLSALSGEDRELIAAVSDALANFRNIVRNDANPLGAEKARPFIEMADRIRARTDLSVSSVSLCTSVKAFGNYDPIEPVQFIAGNPSWSVFYCEIDGFLSQLNEKQLWESKLSLQLRLYNESGIQLWNAAPETVSDTSRKRRRDFFIAKRIQLPSKLAPGPYMLKATVRDLQANRVAESTLQVSIIGK